MNIGGLQDIDYRSKTFSCSQCGSEAYLAVIEPIKEAGMQDYRLDPVERPERHAAAVDRLTGRRRGASVDYSGMPMQDAAAIPDEILGEADTLIRRRLKDRALELPHLSSP